MTLENLQKENALLKKEIQIKNDLIKELKSLIEQALEIGRKK